MGKEIFKKTFRTLFFCLTFLNIYEPFSPTYVSLQIVILYKVMGCNNLLLAVTYIRVWSLYGFPKLFGFGKHGKERVKWSK